MHSECRRRDVIIREGNNDGRRQWENVLGFIIMEIQCGGRIAYLFSVQCKFECVENDRVSINREKCTLTKVMNSCGYALCCCVIDVRYKILYRDSGTKTMCTWFAFGKGFFSRHCVFGYEFCIFNVSGLGMYIYLLAFHT